MFFKSKNRELIKFEEKWINIMANTGVYNKEKQTFSLNELEKTEYGFKSKILIVDGLRYQELESVKEHIEDAFGCMVVFNKFKRSRIVYSEFIFKTPKGIKFNPLSKIEPFEIYLGNSYNGEPILVDMIKYPHVLITGGTRSGKSKMTDCILTNLIKNCNEMDLELYLIQVAKSDLILYEDAIQCRAFADNLDKTLKVLEHIKNKMSERDKLIRPYRKVAKADNYRDYNSINSLSKLSTVIVAFDEMSSLFQENSDKDIKKKIVELIREIAQYGAGLGIFLLCSLQRPTADNLDPFIKSQSTCIVSFRQNNSKSSEVAIDDGSIALGLEQREFIYKTNNYNYGLVPLVDNKKIYIFIKDKLKPGHRNLFRDLKKINLSLNKSKERVITPVEFINTVKTKEDILKENVAKIPNYVPYDSYENLKVIDKSKIPINTEKPKRGKERVDNRKR